MSFDLEDPNGVDDWKSTNSHKGELVIAYNNTSGNNTLHPKVFYALYIKPNGDGNGHLLFKLLTDQIIVIIKYQSVSVPEDLIGTTNKTDSSNNKNPIGSFDIEQSVVQNNHSNNREYNSQTPSNNKLLSEDGGCDELDNSQHLDDLKLDKTVDHEDQVILTKESYNSTSVSMTELTNINTSLPSSFYSVYTKYKVYLYSIYTKP